MQTFFFIREKLLNFATLAEGYVSVWYPVLAEFENTLIVAEKKVASFFFRYTLLFKQTFCFFREKLLNFASLAEANVRS